MPSVLPERLRRINRYLLIGIVLWSALIVLLFSWEVHRRHQECLTLASTEAKGQLRRDLAFRQWATEHGGLYVQVDGKTRPNPYLAHVPMRDIPTPDGGMLTLYNPATALREIMDNYRSLYGLRSRITGLKILNPVNTPDDWERRALLAIEAAPRDITEITDIEGAPFLRMMQPMFMEQGCLKCHAWTGIPVGGVRGGTAVSVPLAGYYGIRDRAVRDAALGYGGIWLLGVLGMLVTAHRGRRHAAADAAAQSAIRQGEARVRLLLDSTAEGIVSITTAGACTMANPAALALLGYAREEEILGRHLHDLAHHHHADGRPYPAGDCPTLQTARHGRPAHVDHEVFWRADGTSFPVEYWAHPVLQDGRIEGVIVAFVDISGREAALAQLRKASQAMEASPNGVIITDAEGVIEYANPKFLQMNGLAAADALGKTPRIVRSGENSATLYEEMWQALRTGREWRGELRNRRADGSLYWCLLSISPIRDAAGRTTHFVAVTEDIDERKFAEATIQRLAFFDPLTDLPNRRLLQDRLERTLARAHRSGGRAGLLYLDLDRFKGVNDSLGHAAGDALLREVARRFSACLREQDTLARLGGDEFAVVLDAVSHAADAEAVARKIVEAAAEPVRVEAHELFLGASVGIAIYPDDGRSAEELLRCADAAMYQAKSSGRNTCQFYAAAANEAVRERLAIEHGLRRAVERDEFSLVYQPKLGLRDGRVYGVEALARWRHPALGAVPPQRFIAVAEETRLIQRLGTWVLREACREARRWREHGQAGLVVSVNLSAVQFRQPDLVDTVRRVLEETGLPPGGLELELTESALMDDPGRAAATMGDLRALGVGLSIDDFGTGYSSLAYLKRFPVQVLKIDRSFVDGIVADDDDRVIAQAVIALARSLGLSTVAEGVEAEAQVVLLRELGCDAVQGYWLSRPIAGEALLRFLALPEEGRGRDGAAR